MIGFLVALLVALAAPGATPRVTLSQTDLQLGGQRARLVLKLVDAKSVMWRGFEAHEGRLVATVRVGRKAWVETDLGDLIDKPRMTFIDEDWSIALADYNGDGLPDFNVGEACGSNNFCYWLFTIDRLGHVRRLQLPGFGKSPGSLWVGDDTYSTRQIEVTRDGIAYSGYDPAHGGFRIRLRWDPEARAFIFADKTLREAASGGEAHAP